jgi:sec-independent protein translocase protein TatA
MPFQLGIPEVIVVIVIALLVLGPKRLPEASRSLGKGIREFRAGISGQEGTRTVDPPHAYTPPRPYTAPQPDGAKIYIPHADQVPGPFRD